MLVQLDPKKYGLVEDLDSFVQCHNQHQWGTYVCLIDCIFLKHLIIVCIEKIGDILTFKFVESLSQPFNDALPVFISSLSFVKCTIIPFIIDAKSSFCIAIFPYPLFTLSSPKIPQFTYMHVKMRGTTKAWIRKGDFVKYEFCYDTWSTLPFFTSA